MPDDHVFFVGNVMIDTLLANRHRFIKPAIWDEKGLKEKEYIVITLHRPVNVDEPDNLSVCLRLSLMQRRSASNFPCPPTDPQSHK